MCSSYYRAHFGADRLILVFAGDVDVAALKRAVTAAFGGWHRAASFARHRDGACARSAAAACCWWIRPSSAQTYFWIANVGVNKHYAQHAALDLVNTLYGGRFTSILNTELRIKSGLSYGARAGFTRSTAAGEFAIRSFTDTENTAKALESVYRDAHAPAAGWRHRRDARLRAAAMCSASIRSTSRRPATGRRRSWSWSSTGSARSTSTTTPRSCVR